MQFNEETNEIVKKETQEIIDKGIASLTKLEEQGTKLKNVENNLDNINNNLDFSNNLVKTMESVCLNIKNNFFYLFSRDSKIGNKEKPENNIIDIDKDNLIHKNSNELKIKEIKVNNSDLEKQLSLIKQININIGSELDNQNKILRNIESTTDNSNIVIKDLNTRIKKLT